MSQLWTHLTLMKLVDIHTYIVYASVFMCTQGNKGLERGMKEYNVLPANLVGTLIVRNT